MYKTPFAKFVPYNNQSPALCSFITNLLSLDVPKNIHDALGVPDWKKICLEELTTLNKNVMGKRHIYQEDRQLWAVNWSLQLNSILRVLLTVTRRG